jgi:hypothetical protein
MKTAVFELAGATVKIQERRWDERYRNSKPRMYVWADQEFSVIEDLANRTRRPYGVWRKAVRANLAGHVGLDLTTMSWSQRAGCSCGCSPGFVLDKQWVTIDEYTFRNFDVYVTLKDAPSIDPTKSVRELLALGF